MPRLPAFCEACGAVFASPLRASRPGEENAFAIPVPCRACGGSGRVPGELLQTSIEAARLFSETAPEETSSFLRLIREGTPREGEPKEELLVETARRAPSFVDLARRLPAGRPEVMEGVAGLLCRVRRRVDAARAESSGSGAGSGRADDRPPAEGDRDESRLEDIVAAAVAGLLEEEGVEPEPSDVPEPLARARRRLAEAGRNDPCPCGSGDKYKECHWIPDLRTTRG